MDKTKRPKRRIARIAGRLIALPLFVMLTAIALLYLPPIQKCIIDKATEYISYHSNYNLSIGKFRLHFPFNLSIHDYTLTQDNDTLLGGERLRINIQPLPLLQGKAEINYITIENSNVDSHSLIDGVRIEGEIGNLRTSVRSYDISSNRVNINRLSLTDTRATISLSDKKAEADTAKNGPSEWFIALNNGSLSNIHVKVGVEEDSISYATRIGESKIEKVEINLHDNKYSLEELSISGSTFRYDKGDAADTISPVNHLHFDNIGAKIENAVYSPKESKIGITHMRFDQKPRGLSLANATLFATGDSIGYTIKKLQLASRNGSNLKADAVIPLKIKSGNVRSNISLILNKKDLQGLLVPDAYGKLASLPDSMLSLTAAVHGTMRKLYIDTIQTTIPHLASIGISGNLGNITAKNRTADLNLTATADNLHKLLYPTASNDTLPKERLRINSRLSLNNGEYATTGRLASDEGTIDIKARYQERDDSYVATANIKNFSLSKLLPEVPLRNVNAILTANGRGFDLFSPETNYRYTLLLDTLIYKEQVFNGITLNANQGNNVSDIHILSTSKGMAATMFARTLLKDSTINSYTNIELKNVELQQLIESGQSLRASMKAGITAYTDLKENHSIEINGEAMQIVYDNKHYTPEKLNMRFSTTQDSTRLNLTNGDLNVNGYMTAGYKAIIGSIEKTVARIQKTIESGDTLIDIRQYEKMLPETSLQMQAKEKNMLAGFLRLKGLAYKEVNLKLNLDTLNGVNSRASILHFEQRDIHLDTLRFALTQAGSRLKYFAGVRSRAMREKDEKATFGAAIYGALQGNELTTNYMFRDKNDIPGMRLGITTRIVNNGFKFRFTPDAILFRHPFTFNADNGIFINREARVTGNFDLRDSAGSGVSLLTITDSTDKRDLSLELHNIDLEAVTKILPFAPNLSGTVNADLHYRETGKGIFLGSDIHSNALAYEGTLIGDESLEISYIPISDKEQHSDVALYHNGDEVARLTGVYNSDSTEQQNSGELTLTRLPVSIANALLKQNNITAKGYLDGNMTISRENNSTIANGYIRFDSVYADLPRFGTNLHLVDDKVEVKESKLQFCDFSIYAKGNTPFTINGTIDLIDLPEAVFDLRMKAANYEIINSKQQKGSMFYGRMFVDLDSRITGPMNSLDVNGSGTILGKSDITYILPNTPLEASNDLDGLVTFTNFKDTARTATETAEQIDFGNINMNLTLHIEEGARINADFDEERTSYIKLQGEGNLNLTYNRESSINLTGRYTLSNGEMKYTLPIIPLKTFSIASGSNITWTGDIMNPAIDITATERVTSSVTIDNNTQATAFDVGVKLTNTLDNMGLSFTLTAPENAAVQNQLNSVDAETLNKYALTMLITGVYTGGDNSLNVSNALSSYLDARINNLVGTAMNSTMDINVGITDVENSDTGDKYKNYSFSFTKRFWNDRLTVIVGGEVNNNEHATNNESFINNVSLEWKISNSGNRYLRLFYDKNYESILEGEITEAGVGYIYKRKMNNLNELLIFRRKDKGTKNKQSL